MWSVCLCASACSVCLVCVPAPPGVFLPVGWCDLHSRRPDTSECVAINVNRLFAVATVIDPRSAIHRAAILYCGRAPIRQAPGERTARRPCPKRARVQPVHLCHRRKEALADSNHRCGLGGLAAQLSYSASRCTSIGFKWPRRRRQRQVHIQAKAICIPCRAT